MKALRLTLTAWPFETMQLGYKDREYRKNIQWVRSRLIDTKTGKPKEYDVVIFRNGYNKKDPYFVAKYLGFEVAQKNYTVEYKTGLKVHVRKGDYRIKLGAIIKRGNIHSKELF